MSSSFEHSHPIHSVFSAWEAYEDLQLLIALGSPYRAFPPKQIYSRQAAMVVVRLKNPSTILAGVGLMTFFGGTWRPRLESNQRHQV